MPSQFKESENAEKDLRIHAVLIAQTLRSSGVGGFSTNYGKDLTFHPDRLSGSLS